MTAGRAVTGLTDSFGRVHTYLRLSVTDRCNYRCVYCMPPEGLEWMPRAEILTFEEVGRLAAIFGAMGVRRVRLTGGEPTLRKDFIGLVQRVGAVESIADLSMTTNGYRLARIAGALKAAGMDRVNVSLDSLDPARFEAITRGGKLGDVLDGVEAAREAGLTPLKLNCVVMAGRNEDEVLPLVEYFSRWADDTVLRFIEYMPFEVRRHRPWTAAQMRAQIGERYTLEPWSEALGGGPAVYWRVRETGLKIGFISPLSEKFCARCNRLRLMADGHLRTCLSDDDTPSLRELLRGGAPDAQIALAIREMVAGKREGHGCLVEGGEAFEGVMTRIGG
jgi:cyclic pyranopterin phosphate synthase